MSIKAIPAVVAALLAACLYAAGWWTAAQGYAKEKAEFEAKAQAQYAQALEAKAVREKYLQGKADEAERKAKESVDEIEARYQELLSASWSAAPDADADGMLADAGGAGGQGGVPATASASGSVSESSGQCARTNGAKLRKLYEEQLTIARDCDITAAHYNELIEFYEKARQSMQ